MAEEIKCFFCAMKELALESKIQELTIEKQRLEFENKALQRKLSAQKRERNKDEMAKQEALSMVK